MHEFSHIREYLVMRYCNERDDRARMRVIQSIAAYGVLIGDWPEGE